jgi:hypothetical protein
MDPCFLFVQDEEGTDCPNVPPGNAVLLLSVDDNIKFTAGIQVPVGGPNGEIAISLTTNGSELSSQVTLQPGNAFVALYMKPKRKPAPVLCLPLRALGGPRALSPF